MNHYKRDKTEPFWWGLFAAGGMVAAMLIPMHLFINGLAPHLGLAGAEVNGYEAMRELISHPLAKLYFLIMIVSGGEPRTWKAGGETRERNSEASGRGCAPGGGAADVRTQEDPPRSHSQGAGAR